MRTNVGKGSRVKGVVADARAEDWYRSQLPKSIVDWNVLESAQPYTFESLCRVYEHCGRHEQQTLYMLKGAAALDCQEVMRAHGLRGVHPQSFEALYGNSLHPNG